MASSGPIMTPWQPGRDGVITSLLGALHNTGWTLDRFGFSPEKIRHRLSDSRPPAVFCVSIPKAGTHLLERALCLHPMLYRKLLPTVSEENIGRWNGLQDLLSRLRPGQILASHLRFRPEYPDILNASGVHGIFLIRDPHDIIVSQVHYISKRKDHRAHALFTSLPDMRSRLRVAITGDAAHRLPSIGERLDYFAGWLDMNLVIRFEDLVGPSGGGSAATQSAAVASIFRSISLPIDDASVASICDRLFSSDSPTFRQGSIGGWRRSFDPELDQLFAEVVGDRSVRYGYPLGWEPVAG